MKELKGQSDRVLRQPRIASTNCLRSDRGAALMGSVLAVLILSTMGMVSVNLAVQEMESLQGMKDTAVAGHLAEAGADLVVTWFHSPASAPAGGGDLFKKRYHLPDGGPSFFDAQGRSQFSGTADRPDLLFDASRAEDRRLMNDPVSGWFRSLRGLGEIRQLKVYGPSRPGLLCTVAVTAAAGKSVKTVLFQLAANSLPPIQSAVQVGVDQDPGRPDHQMPTWVHWGGVKVNGGTYWPDRKAIPVKTELAPLAGLSYGGMSHREDRWLEISVGGQVLPPPSSPDVPGRQEPMPSNVLVQQEPRPGLHLDRWDYEKTKQQALRYGAYYAMDEQGFLYRNGLVAPGVGERPEDLFSQSTGGNRRGLVFIDTLDGRRPSQSNLGTLVLKAEYIEGTFVVNAHVRFVAQGSGLPVSAFTPPVDNPSGSRRTQSPQPVQLAGIHLNGLLYAAGDLVLEGQPKMYGALVVGGQLRQASDKSAPAELWYNHELAGGLVRGIPLVSLVPGSFRELY